MIPAEDGMVKSPDWLLCNHPWRPGPLRGCGACSHQAWSTISACL